MPRSLSEAEVREGIRAKHGEKVTMVRYGGTGEARAEFRCNVCGHEWSTSARSVFGQGTGCRECGLLATAAAMRITVGQVRERIREVHGDTIDMLRYSGSTWKEKSEFRCNVCGHEWSTTAGSVYGSGTGCRECGLRTTAAAQRFSEDEVRERIREVHSGRITMLRYGSGMHRLSDFLCNVCDYTWAVRTIGVTRGSGCPACGGSLRMTEFDVRERIREVHGDRITMLRYGGKVIARSEFRCNVCGHEWSTSSNNIFNNGRGCAGCSVNGFDCQSPARVYLLYNLDLGAAKVGVTTAANDSRLRVFARNGWKHYWMPKRFATGAEAIAEERRILADWRAQGYPEALTAEDMPMGGWTETAPLSALPGWELLVEDSA